jgi:NADH-quinone oxidoreductase E subunit
MTTAPETFEFTAENRERAEMYIRRYPEGRQASAVLALLDLAQRQSGGWLPRAAMEHVAATLGMAPIRVYEVATFYEMFNLDPVGEHVVRVCTTTPCMLCGGEDIMAACKDELGVGVKQTTADGKFTLQEFECLGACVNAPIVWIDDDFYEDLDPEAIRDVLKRFRAGERPEPGSVKGRQKSAPASGPKTLTTGGTAG